VNSGADGERTSTGEERATTLLPPHLARFETAVRSVVTERAFTVFAVLIVCYVAVRSALRIAIDFNEAYNIAVAKGIGSSFSYAIENVPRHFSYLTISANGPIQYIGGLGYALTHQIDGALVAGVLSSALVLSAGLILLRPWLIALGVVLVFTFPAFTGVLIQFNGYVWAAGAALVGFALLERALRTTPFRDVWRSRAVWVAAAWFSAALASKLIIMFGVAALAFAAAFNARHPRGPSEILRDAALSACTAAIVGIMASLLFFVQFAFAAVHTARSLSALAGSPGLFVGYFHETFAQGYDVVAARPGVAMQFASFDSHLVLAALIVATVVLVASRPAYAPLVAVAAGLWLRIGMDETHMSSYFVILLALGTREAAELVGRAAKRYDLAPGPARVYAFGALFVLALLLNPLFGADAIPAGDPQRAYAVQLSTGEKHYSPQLVERLRSYPFVFTSGYWQFPEISDRWRFEFFDRTSPENAQLWDKNPVLLFDRSNHAWPVTSVQDNCGKVLMLDGDIVLCTLRPDVPLSYQAPVPSGTKLRDVSLSSANWTLSPNVRRVAGPPSRNPLYEYTGTGAPDSVSGTTDVTVQPGETYVFSAWVDPSGLRGVPTGEFALLILNERSISYTSMFYPVGPPGRYSTAPWKCPPGTTRVRLAVGLIQTTVARGAAFAFSAARMSTVVAPSMPPR
jgi:hypothetical protein